jgi:uncharacterized protein YbcV (DUF1398 family)
VAGVFRWVIKITATRCRPLDSQRSQQLFDAPATIR